MGRILNLLSPNFIFLFFGKNFFFKDIQYSTHPIMKMNFFKDDKALIISSDVSSSNNINMDI